MWKPRAKRLGPHSNRVPPTVDAAVAEVRRRVTALADAGAVDAGNDSVLDPLITAWVGQWHVGLDQDGRGLAGRLKRRRIASRSATAAADERVKCTAADVQAAAAVVDRLTGPATEHANGNHIPHPQPHPAADEGSNR